LKLEVVFVVWQVKFQWLLENTVQYDWIVIAVSTVTAPCLLKV